MRGGAGDGPNTIAVPASASVNFLTTEDSMSDDVFEMDDDRSSTVTNVISGGLTPATIERSFEKTPSPTGYRDYKPPAEVLSNNYSTTFKTTSDFDSVRSALKKDQERDDNFAHKTILLGDSGVGKTSLLVQFDTGRFQPGNFAATVGIGFTNKVVTVDDTPIKLQIWDTAGQERFRSVTHAYYRDAHALLLLYDVTNKTSYDNIRAWLSEIREHANEDVVIMLLGNKSDCGTERAVKREDGERLAQEYKVPFMETSAKTGLNVELAFLAVARELKARKSDNPDETKFNVQDYVRQQSQRSSCFNSSCLTT
ncbi:PREDICTED: ras-related protein Rab-37 isoform X1 [Acromyrmex echinatior]|uniref:ras-related protein Rab-37 isoform X1 n=1 Tax=Acromyrmex echinatior TaxID=103372 RepID=UPI000580FFEC|nr:PREDICTED: ras-related protein Rab-37 isoform X1 [Acromyrmex echinatior]XP_011064914.1 PREDICTED: ras-related protein Rab-37 isoform X1 [Acromyrmex echinatior]XP_011064916.1 PREDICTED: ras-related protein Rab-37 isoform X1 [Acromyrmex echinatior]XP_011064917.1 PREDICTED: ras-related protein Rab-37 isoform X1 [Acromyrmex echinatior]